jgi:death on curing protein
LPPVEPSWLPLEEVLEINVDALEPGEQHSVWKPEELHAAMASPRNQWLYGEEDIVVLASILCCRLARYHCFEAANKRTSLMAAAIFLDWNGYELLDDDTLGPQLERVVAHNIDEGEFAEVLRVFVV